MQVDRSNTLNGKLGFSNYSLNSMKGGGSRDKKLLLVSGLQKWINKLIHRAAGYFLEVKGVQRENDRTRYPG